MSNSKSLNERDTARFKINSEHLTYVSKLPKETFGLILRRDFDCLGSWDTLEKLLAGSYTNEVRVLREYEKTHGIDLGFYAELYHRHYKGRQRIA